MNDIIEAKFEQEKEIRDIFRKYLEIPSARIDFLVNTFQNWQSEDLFNLSLAIYELKVWKENKNV